jgi:chemotaxis protein MotB
MMSLLLTFFIMLVAMSELKTDDKYRQVVQSVKEAFGYVGGIGAVPSYDPPEVSPIIRQMAQADQNFKTFRGESSDPAPEGRRPAVTVVREGADFRLGGKAAFEEGKAELIDDVKPALREVADKIRGYNNKIEVRGHTSKVPLPADCACEDHMALSVARAMAVRKFLIAEGQIEPSRVRVCGAGATEPLVARAYEEAAQEQNSRVEIAVMESLVQDLVGESPTTAGAAE